MTALATLAPAILTPAKAALFTDQVVSLVTNAVESGNTRRATSDPFRRLGNGQVNGKRREKRDYTGALARGARAARGRQVRQARGNSTAYSVLTRGMAWGPRVVACET